mmetsp:Transcript_29370/g.87615  ORF Transcript_29370/g.87615 Transcript_29370/m.87615 type:complete len:264 (+) Transcript_29370:1034-1825(+)
MHERVAGGRVGGADGRQTRGEAARDAAGAPVDGGEEIGHRSLQVRARAVRERRHAKEHGIPVPQLRIRARGNEVREAEFTRRFAPRLVGACGRVCSAELRVVRQVEPGDVPPAEDCAVRARGPDSDDVRPEGRAGLVRELRHRGSHRGLVRRPSHTHVRAELIEDVWATEPADVGNLFGARRLGQRIDPLRHALVGRGEAVRRVDHGVRGDARAGCADAEHREFSRGVGSAERDAAALSRQLHDGGAEGADQRVAATLPLGKV